MASKGRCGGAPAHEDEPRREERVEQQAPALQGPVLPPTAACGLWSIHARSGASHADAGSYPGNTPGTVGGLVLAEGQLGVNINGRLCCVGVNHMDANTKSSVQRCGR
ncbi:hypothetical protein Taro_038972, partial [Colocasia esculenta]|nr:hypothetical protein [Colocasia esculenta]